MPSWKIINNPNEYTAGERVIRERFQNRKQSKKHRYIPHQPQEVAHK